METVLLGVLGIIGTACLGVLTWSATRKTNLANRQTLLETRVDNLESDKAAQLDYIQVLRQHITDENPPPPPPYPEGMLR